MLSAFKRLEAERLETQDVAVEAQRPLDILYPPVGVVSIGYLHLSRKSFRGESYQTGHRISVGQGVGRRLVRRSPAMPARPATARFRPARSLVPSTAGGSRGGAGDEMPWAPLPARLRPHHPEPRRSYYPHAYHSTLSALRRRPVSFLPSLVVHAEQFQGSCHVFRALDPVARRRPAVRKRRMRDRPTGADQLVPDLSGEPEVGVAVVVDVSDLRSPCLGISVPVAGDAEPTWTVLIPLLEDSISSQELTLYLHQRFIVHPIPPHFVRPTSLMVTTLCASSSEGLENATAVRRNSHHGTGNHRERPGLPFR